MEKVILNEEAVHFGKVNCPEGFEINREEIKYEIMNGYIDNKDKFLNQYPVGHCIHLDYLNSYIDDFFRLKEKNKSALCLKETFSFILKQDEKIEKRNYFNVFDIPSSPVYTLIYGVELEDFSSELIIYYNNKRTPGLKNYFPLENNKFVMFPSHLNFEITENKSKLNAFYLINNYFEI